jgi:hypothetical protein
LNFLSDSDIIILNNISDEEIYEHECTRSHKKKKNNPQIYARKNRNAQACHAY